MNGLNRKEIESLSVDEILEIIKARGFEKELGAIKDNFTVFDRTQWVIRDASGKIKREGVYEDLITNAGMAAVAGLIGNTGAITPFTFLGIGKGTTPAAVGDTALQTVIKIKAATVSRVTTTATNDTLQLVATFSKALDSISGTSAWTEVGVMNATSAYIMLMHQVNTAETLNWDAGDTLALTVQIQIKQGV